jgi:hypothetical protein
VAAGREARMNGLFRAVDCRPFGCDFSGDRNLIEDMLWHLACDI